MIETINLKENLIQWMGRRQFRGGSRGTLWASESSAKFVNDFGEYETVGKCHRAVWYRLNGVKETNPPTGKSQVVFLLGNAVEDALTEMCKQMGIWENNSVRWEDKQRNISGEFDIICRQGNDLWGVECKSFYGYVANKTILGHHSGRGRNKVWNPGKPKDEHLMQTAVYVDQTRDKLNGFKIVYISRDKCDIAEFNITSDDDKNIYINGVKETRFTINDIYNRYMLMNTYIAEGTKPRREFTKDLSDERVQSLHERGDISDSAYKKHNDRVDRCSDWHCGYCNYSDYCWKVDTDDLAEHVEVQMP
jgi:hypothetical protein